jgi:hypothetical protein
MNHRWVRLPVVILAAFWTVRLSLAETPWCFLDRVNLAFHEAGHLVLAPFGETLHLLGGSLGQIAVPVLLAVYFFRRDERFGAAACTFWLGENFINIAAYMADARTLALPLVGGGENDWNTLFYRFGLLGEGSVAAISGLTHHLGVVTMLAGLLWSLLFVLPGALLPAALARSPLLKAAAGDSSDRMS